MARASRYFHAVSAANFRELATIDDESGVLDGRATIAYDQPRAFEHNGIARWSRRGASDGREQHETERNPHATRIRLHSVHRILQNIDRAS